MDGSSLKDVDIDKEKKSKTACISKRSGLSKPSSDDRCSKKMKSVVVDEDDFDSECDEAPIVLPKKIKPLPPAQAVRESKNEPGRGGRGYGRGRGGSGGFNRGFSNSEQSPAGQGAVEEGDSGRERRGYGGPRGDFSNGEGGEGERSRRPFERRSGTGRGSEFKREEAVNETEKNFGDENPKGEGGAAADGNEEAPLTEQEEKEHEDKEMTLEEYQKVLEEKRKALQTLKAEERKVDTKEFASMQQISSKKENQDIFIKLGSEKDKKKETAERDERAKKSVSINEFLKPAEGERYFTSGGRGRGRGRGGSRGGGFAGNYQSSNVSAPSIEDPGHFPTLGGK
ncbi:hypothetical protein F8388_005077 [Cannabis sativa]|uniref:Hyaluronan/mRNA-binding protein domain-containing protein n=1 Tax=Cannabis sativa TaxID=3483 RepID=A0A7J6DWE3_CANSA|nr:hypothetical protein F8388_005077 [Cannabis sativa]KAF4402199.1 hypothetical protein G4B88_017711 [Cannabis sativa]